MKTQEILNIVIGLIGLTLVVSGLFLYFKLRKFEKFYRKFFQGKEGQDLESVMVRLDEQVRKLTQDLKTLSSANRVVAELQQTSIQHMGVVRFNSFADQGGNNSFALALLDAHGNGCIISSLYGRETGRVYLKPVEAGESKIPLTEEEKKAILESHYQSH